MLHEIASIFTDELQNAINTGGREPQIVQNFVIALRSHSFPSAVEVRTAFIHQKPYAFFANPPSLCGKIKCEVGDLAYVIKRVRGQAIIDHRVCFAQAKRVSGDIATVEAHQLEFYVRLYNLIFRFGNSVYTLGGVRPILFRHLTRSTSFGHYLLLGSPNTFVAKPSLIDTQDPQNSSNFDFVIPPLCPHCLNTRRPLRGFFDYETFLLNFLELKGLGPSITRQVRDFVTIIYKRVGWDIDPPEETEGYFAESKSGGFGIIEIKISLAE